MSTRSMLPLLMILAVGVAAGFALGDSRDEATRTITTAAGVGAPRTVTTSRTITVTRRVTVPQPSADAIRAVHRNHAGLAADAKTQARALVAYVERCWTSTQDFTLCQTPAQLHDAVRAGLRLGNRPGTVGVTAASDRTYVIGAVARDSRVFNISRDATGIVTRTCSSPGTEGCSKRYTW